MEEFIRKYVGRVLDDWGVACSTEFKTFANNFKNALYREFPESTIYGFQANCYILSGFLKTKKKLVYISYNYPRKKAFDPKCGHGFSDRICVRQAKDRKDFKGSRKYFCDFYHLAETIKAMM